MKIKTIYTMIAMAAILCSCSNSEPSATTQMRVRVNFDISNVGMSRTGETWDDTYQPEGATAAERNISRLQGFVYDGTTLLGMLENITAGTTAYSADLTTSVPIAELVGSNITLHLVANGATYTAPAAPSGIKDLTGTRNLTTTTPLPMWGIGQCTAATTPEGDLSMDFGTVYLLRSLAKVEVKVVTPTETLSKVRVTGKLGTSYYIMPPYATEGITHTGSVERNPSTFTVPSEATNANVSIDATDNKVVFYLPEQLNTEEGEIKIYLTFDGSEESSTPLMFRNYVDGIVDAEGEPKNILRNHVYRFSISIDNGVFSVIASEWDHTYDDVFNF